MDTHLRFTPVLAVIGALALGGAPALRAQDTSSVRSDTSAQADTSAFKGYGADTAAADTFHAAQPTAGDTAKTGQTGATAADTVVCKDGSHSPRSGSDVCLRHGGIDWAATEAALKARGETGVQTGPTDSSAAAQSDTSSSQ